MRLIRDALAVGFMVGVTSLMAAPAIVPLKSSIDFGKKVPGEPGVNWMEAAYSNRGDQSLTFTGAGISLQGQDAGDFRFREVPTTAPMSYGSRYVNLEFAPGSVGSKEAALVFTTNDPDDPTTSILLTGEAVPFRGTLVNGPYDGYGPGQSTVGTGGDYGSLQEAVTAIDSHPLTGGDWSFLILNDLHEPGSLLIGQPNTSSNTITLRPAPNTNPTVTFTSTTNRVNNVTVSGHIIIGSKIERRWPNPPRLLPVKMQNFVLDGCNTVGGTERNLTLTNVDSSANLVMVHTMGDADRVAIRNCRFDCFANQPGTPGYNYNNVILFLGIQEQDAVHLGQGVIWGSPDYGEVVNCDFQTTRATESVIAVNALTGVYSAQPRLVPANGTRITRNKIRSQGGSGTRIGFAYGADITSNSIVVNEPKSSNYAIVSGIAVSAASPEGSPAMIRVVSNSITYLRSTVTSSYGEAGIDVTASSGNVNFQVINNTVSGVLAPIGINAPGTGFGIAAYVGPNSSATIVHNSIALRNRPGYPVTTATRCAAVCLGKPYTSGFGNAAVHNNILFTDIPNSGCIVSINPLGGGLQSDYNDLAYLNGAVAGFDGAGSYATISDWQDGVAQDAYSISQDPFVPALPGAGVWVGPSDSGSPDLHFTAHPGAVYKVPQFAEIDTDIDGNARPENYTLMGAHQPPGPPAAVAAWEIY